MERMDGGRTTGCNRIFRGRRRDQIKREEGETKSKRKKGDQIRGSRHGHRGTKGDVNSKFKKKANNIGQQKTRTVCTNHFNKTLLSLEELFGIILQTNETCAGDRSGNRTHVPVFFQSLHHNVVCHHLKLGHHGHIRARNCTNEVLVLVNISPRPRRIRSENFH